MNSPLHRQLKDIQIQGDRLLQKNPALREMEEFHKYNHEFRTYLLNHLPDIELRVKVNQIPDILEEDYKRGSLKNILYGILHFASPLLGDFFKGLKTIENAKANITIAIGIYSAIEFRLRNMSWHLGVGQ